MELSEQSSGTDHKMVMQVGRQNYNTYKGTGYSNNAGKYQKRLTKEERAKLKCTHCQVNGHEAHQCFKLHGYPDWYKRLKENRNNPRVNYVKEDDDVKSRTDSG